MPEIGVSNTCEKPQVCQLFIGIFKIILNKFSKSVSEISLVTSMICYDFAQEQVVEKTLHTSAVIDALA